MRVLVGCECSGVVRRAFRARGHDAWSCDLKPAEDGSKFHFRCDLRQLLHPGVQKANRFNMLIAHPDCTFMANSGVRWLKDDVERWAQLKAAARFFRMVLDAPFDAVCVENPVMHKHAKDLIGVQQTQTVQPHWFGDPKFKATCLWLRGLPPLVPTNKLTPPAKGTPEHKAWSTVHREPPGPNRKRNRSVTFQGLAEAMADQWGHG